MLEKKDTQWWVLEAQKHPESAVDLIRMLADRLAFLDKQNEELRGELITLRRKQRVQSEEEVLRQRIRELETALQQQGAERQVIIYARDRIEFSGTLDIKPDSPMTIPITNHTLSGISGLLTCTALSTLLILTEESQVFALSYTDLPKANSGPAMFGNPDNVAVILEQSLLENHRFLVLMTEKGYLYSVLTASIPSIAKRREKLLRSLIPGDPIVAAIPSYNAELFALSRTGRWSRFSERSISSTGSLAIELPKNDTIAGIVPIQQESELLFFTTDGRIFLRSSKEFKAGRGTFAKGQTFIGVGTSEDIVVMTAAGKILSTKASTLPTASKTDTGYLLRGIGTGSNEQADTIIALEVR